MADMNKTTKATTTTTTAKEFMAFIERVGVKTFTLGVDAKPAPLLVSNVKNIVGEDVSATPLSIMINEGKSISSPLLL